MQCIYDSYASRDKHRVAEAEEAVAFAHRLLIGGKNVLAPRERAHQHDERGLRQVEIRDKRIHHLEAVARIDVSASFFVFAIHDPWLLSNIRKLLYVTLHPASDFAMVVVYFFNILLTVTIALALYYCLKKISPKFTAIITGGR